MSKTPQSNVIEELMSRADIIEVISSYMPLKKVGANYLALCPFHQEKTPSFNISPVKQVYYCFGCGEGGNVITFVKKFENVSSFEAVNILARQYNIVINGENFKRQEEKQPLYHAMEEATKYYQQVLQNSATSSPVREYIRKRKISDEMIELFRIGVAPAGWNTLIKALTSKGLKVETLKRAGLCKPSSTGNSIDIFRDRLMFPISNIAGKVVAFGGRVMDIQPSNSPKYINSPETPIYHKSSMLYGLDLAKNRARVDDQLLVVEGYMDVISLRSAGIENCVAVAGVAFTNMQAQAIKRVCNRVVLMFDSDNAGLKASRKSIPVLLDHGLNVFMLRLPGVKDPDEFIARGEANQFNDLLEQAPSFPQFIIDTTLKSAELRTVEGKSAAAREILPFINRIRDRLERDQYLEILAEKMGINKKLLLNEIGKSAQNEMTTGQQKSSGDQKPTLGVDQAEKILIRILIEKPKYLDTLVPKLSEDNFRKDEHKLAFRLIIKAKQQGIDNFSDILNLSTQDSVNKALTSIVLDPDLIDEEFMEQAVVDCYKKVCCEPEGRLAILKEQVNDQRKIDTNSNDNRLTSD